MPVSALAKLTHLNTQILLDQVTPSRNTAIRVSITDAIPLIGAVTAYAMDRFFKFPGVCCPKEQILPVRGLCNLYLPFASVNEGLSIFAGSVLLYMHQIHRRELNALHQREQEISIHRPLLEAELTNPEFEAESTQALRVLDSQKQLIVARRKELESYQANLLLLAAGTVGAISGYQRILDFMFSQESSYLRLPLEFFAHAVPVYGGLKAMKGLYRIFSHKRIDAMNETAQCIQNLQALPCIRSELFQRRKADIPEAVFRR